MLISALNGDSKWPIRVRDSGITLETHQRVFWVATPKKLLKIISDDYLTAKTQLVFYI